MKLIQICQVRFEGKASIKSEIESIGPFLLLIYTLRSLKANVTDLKAPTNFICVWMIFTVVADSRRECGIAFVLWGCMRT
jgi:hypothetical protein